jgi:hypothetical protein
VQLLLLQQTLPAQVAISALPFAGFHVFSWLCRFLNRRRGINWYFFHDDASSCPEMVSVNHESKIFVSIRCDVLIE